MVRGGRRPGGPVDFTPNEDHEAIREGVQRVCADFPDSYWREMDDGHEFPWEYYKAMADGGWIGIAIPEQYGGGGQGISEAAIVVEEVAASGAAMNGCTAIHLSIFGMNPVVKYGSDDMRQKYLPATADGSLQVAFGVTEPDAGTDTLSITTRATRDGEQYIVNGRKVWTSKATYCDKCLLLVRTTPKDEVKRGVEGMTLLLADIQRPEVEITPIPKAGRNAVVSCEVVYDDLPVPVTDRVGEEGMGFRYLLEGLNPERILVAAEAVGIGKAALRKAVQYGQDRVVFGRPIGQNQGLSFPLAECHARLHAAELVVSEAAWRYDNGLPCGEQANLAKWLAADAGYQTADQAVQTHGGMGYAKEYDVERYWREARVMKLAPISQEMVMNYVAEHVLRLPRSY
ncbi:MAG: acyl-CoA/acyl-ACP dehydrogenase [Actinomycetia bacterium]|nr:acyl-CoA/acyl-ACP dehydrogenase [Actinomycetes bacterium]